MNPCVSKATLSAQNYFPRGLSQPAKGYRFSMDALLLACFLKTKKNWHIADLGTGCAAAGLAVLLQDKTDTVCVTGIEYNTALLEHARHNASALGLNHRFTALHADVVSLCHTTGNRPESAATIRPESMNAVLCNPPYREAGTGRLPDEPGKQAARFMVRASLESFVQAAGYLVKNKGPVVFIGLAERLPELLEQFSRFRLTPKQLQMIHSYHDSPARLALVCGIKNAGPGLEVCPPLVLYQNRGPGSQLTKTAAEFCPFLQCNNSSARALYT